MEWLWRAVNIAILVASVWGGLDSMAAQEVGQTNTDEVACLAVAIGSAFVAVFGSYYGIRRYGLVRRPRWDRIPLRLWGDPLQFIFTSELAAFGATLGGLLGLPASNPHNLWGLGVDASLLIGLVIGHVLVYRVFRRNITN